MRQAIIRILFFTLHYVVCISLQGGLDYTTRFSFQKGCSSLKTDDLQNTDELLPQDSKKKAYTQEIKVAGVIGVGCLFYILLGTYFVFSLKSGLDTIKSEVDTLETRKSKPGDHLVAVMDAIDAARAFAIENGKALGTLKNEFESGNIAKSLNDEHVALVKVLNDKTTAHYDQMKNEYTKLKDKAYTDLAQLGVSIGQLNKNIKATMAELDRIDESMKSEDFQRITQEVGVVAQVARKATKEVKKILKAKSFDGLGFGKKGLGKLIKKGDSGKPRLDKFRIALDTFSEKYTNFRNGYRKVVPPAVPS